MVTSGMVMYDDDADDHIFRSITICMDWQASMGPAILLAGGTKGKRTNMAARRVHDTSAIYRWHVCQATDIEIHCPRDRPRHVR